MLRLLARAMWAPADTLTAAALHLLRLVVHFSLTINTGPNSSQPIFSIIAIQPSTIRTRTESGASALHRPHVFSNSPTPSTTDHPLRDSRRGLRDTLPQRSAGSASLPALSGRDALGLPWPGRWTRLGGQWALCLVATRWGDERGQERGFCLVPLEVGISGWIGRIHLFAHMKTHVPYTYNMLVNGFNGSQELGRINGLEEFGLVVSYLSKLVVETLMCV